MLNLKNKKKQDQDLGRKYFITMQNIIHTYRLNPSLIITVYYQRYSKRTKLIMQCSLKLWQKKKFSKYCWLVGCTMIT